MSKFNVKIDGKETEIDSGPRQAKPVLEHVNAMVIFNPVEASVFYGELKGKFEYIYAASLHSHRIEEIKTLKEAELFYDRYGV